ncbi:MAG TPA: hypothetical protein VK932_13620 [Kofleriaceae bacterium]|nr:hypothetical protein [Kofleriaceae bacterium]
MAQRSEAASRRRRKLEDEDGFLHLTSDGTPKTVYVKDLGNGSAGFGDSEEGPFFPDGMKWNPDRDSTDDLFITFVLMEGITGIAKSTDAPTIFLSALVRDGASQDGCAPMASESTTTYSFNVQVGNALHDPKIVVTPQ